jgi:hypothetical protein
LLTSGLARTKSAAHPWPKAEILFEKVSAERNEEVKNDWKSITRQNHSHPSSPGATKAPEFLLGYAKRG